MDRPDLTELDATGEQYGIVTAPGLFDERDWAGPFPTPEDAEAELTKLGDDGEVVTWDARRVALAQAMSEHGIHPNQDYDFSELIEVLAGETDCGRYGAIRHDETYTIIALYETPEEAAADLASSVSEDTLNSPVGVLDLDTRKLARPKVSVGISFDD